jgi:hypothetical protein
MRWPRLFPRSQSQTNANGRHVAPPVQPLVSDASFRILLDVPARNPALGFPNSAAALAKIVTESEPRFAIGIFGGWGSGKTTLMRAIEARVSDEVAVPVQFAAWRYEKEEHLIVPLLDTVREALVLWADANGEAAAEARRAAATVGKVMKSIVAGLAIKVGVPGAIDLSFEANKALAYANETRRGDEEAQVPRSFYHASFRALQSAFHDFVGDPPRRRIVVFVDDLDRCLPESALQVLESMKLFFDVEGFVFVVGLDEDVIKYIVASKYERSDSTSTDGAPLTVRVTGEDYVKKIFQLPYSLAPVAFEQLNEFLQVAYEEAALPGQQRQDLDTVVRPHLRFIVRESTINPREIKRYINSYILLTKINPELDRNAVLALQTVAFRDEWSDVRDAVLEYGEAFVDALRRRVNEREDGALQDLDPDLARIPQGFIDYLRPGAPGNALLLVDEIDKYVYTGEAVRSARNRRLLDAIRRIADIRRALREAGDGPLNTSAMLENASFATASFPSAVGAEQELLIAEFDELRTLLGSIEPKDSAAEGPRAELDRLTTSIRTRLLAIYRAGDISGAPQFSSGPVGKAVPS